MRPQSSDAYESKEASKLVTVEPRISQDARERAALELPM